MSLKLWMPFISNTENQGLCSATTFQKTVNAYTAQTSGKLGSTYSGYGLYHANEEFVGNQWSLAVWVNAISFGQYNNIIFCKNISSSTDCHIYWSVISNTTYNIGINGPSGTTTYAYTFATNTWYHLATTYDGSRIKMYINGSLVKDVAYASTQPTGCLNFGLGARSGNTAGTSAVAAGNWKFNDFRLYDTAISAKEVHELAKGLVLHYKFDDPYVESTTNLVPIPVDTGAANNAWDASLHTGARTVSGWGTGYNGGVGTPASGYHACWKIIENKPTMVYQNINSDYGMIGRWLGISTVACYPAINAGETYTISFEMMTVSKRQANFPYVFGGWYYKLTSSASSRSFHDGYFYLSNTKIGAWEKVSIVKTRASGFDNNTDYQAFYIYGQSSTEGIMYVRNVQVEKKDHATPYTGEAATSWNGTSVVYDSSGFGYNGTPTNLATHTPSARYTNCSQFNGVDSRIVVPYNTVCPENIFTVNLWWKKDALGSKSYETLFGGPSGFEMDTRAGANTTLCLYMAGVRGSTLYSPLSLGQWYMFTMVRDGTNEFYYINGELVKTIDAKPMPVGTYFIGAWSSPTSQNYYGQISDFRLYSTTLSAADVLELYHTEAAVGRGGEVFAREVIER